MTNKVEKFFRSLDKKTRERIKIKLKELKKDPFDARGVKKMKDWGDNIYRLRIGKIRLIYEVIENDIEIVDINYRGNIY